MASNIPTVSVLIGTYNRATLLPRALASVLRQQDADFEIVVVDDASTDNTSEVVRHIADHRIKYVRHEINRGIAVVSNTAYRASRGGYLALLGDDDEWTDRYKLRKQIDVFQEQQKEEIGIVATWWRDVVEGRTVKDHTPNTPQDWIERILIGNGIICGSSAMISRKAWETVGGFDEFMKRGTDSELFRSIIARGFGVEIIPECMVNVDVSGRDRMTLAHTEARIDTSMAMIRYLLEKYADLFADYSSAKAGRLYQLADLARERYFVTHNRCDLRLSERYISEALKYKFGVKPVTKHIVFKVLGEMVFAALMNAGRVIRAKRV